jgi:hypothetical protein
VNKGLPHYWCVVDESVFSLMSILTHCDIPTPEIFPLFKRQIVVNTCQFHERRTFGVNFQKLCLVNQWSCQHHYLSHNVSRFTICDSHMLFVYATKCWDVHWSVWASYLVEEVASELILFLRSFIQAEIWQPTLSQSILLIAIWCNLGIIGWSE